MRGAWLAMTLLLCGCSAPKSKNTQIRVNELFDQGGQYSVLLRSSYCSQCSALQKDVRMPGKGFYTINIDEFAVYDYFAYSSNVKEAKEKSIGATSVSEINFVAAPLILEIEDKAIKGYFCGYAECKEYLEGGINHAS